VSALSVGRRLRFGVRRGRAVEPRALLVPRVVGVCALLLTVCASVWIAVGASDGNYWLELPGGGNPTWITGPLRGLASTVGSLPPSALSACLIVMGAGYVVALVCTRSGSVSLRAALAAVVAANLAFTLGPTLLSTDVFGYIAYGRLGAVHGLNPYVFPPGAAPHDAVLPFVYWQHATSPYGPLFTALSAPLGLLSNAAALWVFKAIAGAASIALAVLVALIARRRGGNPALATIFVGLNPVLLFYAVSGAHNDLLAAALVLGAVALVLAGRDRGAGAVAVSAAAIKLTLGLALPFVLLGARHRRRALIGTFAALLAIGIPTLLVFGTHVFDQLHRISSDPQFDIAYSGPDRLATLFGGSIGPGVRFVSLLFAGASVLAAVIWAWRGGDAVTAAGWAALGVIASIASLAPWYLAWLLPLAALGRSRALRVAALATTGYLLVVHLPAFGHQPWLSPPGKIAAVVSTPR
jgi:hypothetical protein